MNANQHDLPIDVVQKLEADFSQDELASARRLLGGYSGKERLRVIRCIVHLAKGNADSLLHFIDEAAMDYRDVIYWAEYDRNDRRIHDFNLPF